MDFVVIESAWSGKNPLEQKDIVIPLSVYDADLGIQSRSSIKRQLQIDVPRSHVTINGVRTTSWVDVYRHAKHPRMCTQAVLAPVVEWFIKCGIVMYERRSPMQVNIEKGKISILKTLGLRSWDNNHMGDTDVCIHAERGMVIVSLFTTQCDERIAQGKSHETV